jgi:hypothetical protein
LSKKLASTEYYSECASTPVRRFHGTQAFEVCSFPRSKGINLGMASVKAIESLINGLPRNATGNTWPSVLKPIRDSNLVEEVPQFLLLSGV